MAILTHKCPHCLTDHVGLRLAAISKAGERDFAAHLWCPKCYKPSAAIVQAGRITVTVDSLVQSGGDLEGYGYHILDFWPAAPGPSIPDHLPEPASRAFLQAERNFPISGNEEAAGTMYRKALDVGLKAVAPALTGTLYQRIDKMVEQHLLTPAIGEWAHQIRLLGNDSAHEEDAPTRDELIALRSFTDLALQYLFTLPKMVELRKASESIK